MGINFADLDKVEKGGGFFVCFFFLLSFKDMRKKIGHYCHSWWRSCPGGWIVGKTKSAVAAYGSHYLPLWLKARVCPPASTPGLRPSHRPQLFLLVPVYHLIMCALLTIVVRPVCIWRGGLGCKRERKRERKNEMNDKCEKSADRNEKRCSYSIKY